MKKEEGEERWIPKTKSFETKFIVCMGAFTPTLSSKTQVLLLLLSNSPTTSPLTSMNERGFGCRGAERYVGVRDGKRAVTETDTIPRVKAGSSLGVL